MEFPAQIVAIDFIGMAMFRGLDAVCPNCVNPLSKLKTVTFRSWDSRILRKLPRALAASFPAMLTYRSGLSESVFMFMRSCFQSGMGAKQFADALRVRHLEQYDKLHISYLSTLAENAAMARFMGWNFKSFLPFEDNSEDGFHGFLPSSQWLRDLFDKFVMEHSHEYDQHTALLSAYISAIDHSFKLAKHIAKVNGEQIFIALLTVTNERGEIRICNLVATKSHSQFELALNRMRESLDRYGHDQPAIFYTDNMADKDFLERCFPSLRDAVVAVEKYPHLDTLEIPSSVRTCILDTVSGIDTAMGSILHDLPDTNSKEKLVIFVDSEWNVETSAQGYVTGRGQTAILQIAYKDHIYILQIGKMLSGATLPKILIQLLANPRVLKVGRSVNADLKYLQETVQSKAPFVGGVDLAKLAKERLLVSSAKIGLADLCATILERRLNKNVSERLSSAWDREQLTESQVRYAALDVYACLCIYDAIISIPIPSPLPKNPAIGTPVLVFNADQGRVIARGKITGLDGIYDKINISQTRCRVEVTHVLVPAAIITTHHRKALSMFGPAPFDIVCTRTHVRLGTSFETFRNVPTGPQPYPDADPSSVQPDELEPSNFGELLLDELNSSTARNPAAVLGCNIDQNSAEEGARILNKPKRIELRTAQANDIKDLLISPQLITGWVNGNLYQQTNETSGVLPIPDDIRNKYGVATFEPSLDFKKTASSSSRLPTVHSEGSSPGQQRRGELPEQLKAYFNGSWKTNMNIKQTKALTFDVCVPLAEQLRDPVRLSMAPKVPETSMELHHVPSGLLALDDDETADLSSAEPILDLTAQSSAPVTLYTGLPSSTGMSASAVSFAASSSLNGAVQAAPPPTRELLIEKLSKKRVAQNLPQNPHEKKRARRTCRKCGIPYCNGSRGVDFCTNRCRDCGKAGSDKSCVGRNPKYPNIICTQARWP
ncbi:hypothetical protein B0H12DRAFT_1236604 [Mycena haematopus]|nr:hypothetical protein B0H12DRAFT_1236604 [Mycena haematopus]